MGVHKIIPEWTLTSLCMSCPWSLSHMGRRDIWSRRQPHRHGANWCSGQFAISVPDIQSARVTGAKCSASFSFSRRVWRVIKGVEFRSRSLAVPHQSEGDTVITLVARSPSADACISHDMCAPDLHLSQQQIVTPRTQHC